MEPCQSHLSEVEQQRLQVESLKRAVERQDEKHRLAIRSAENFLNFLRCLYGDDF